MTRPRLLRTLPLILLICAVGCAHRCPLESRGLATLLRTELYFGLSRPDSKTISDADWKAFLDAHVTTRFKEGLTVLNADGQFLNQAGTLIAEKAKVVVLIYPDSPDREAAIQSIVSEYKQQFQQESVLRVTTRAGVSF